MKLLARLDAYGTDHPGFREGHPEDRCPVCGRPVVDHPSRVLADVAWRAPAKWPHRRAAAAELLADWIERTIIARLVGARWFR